jgi:hypothetical protein
MENGKIPKTVGLLLLGTSTMLLLAARALSNLDERVGSSARIAVAANRRQVAVVVDSPCD